MKYEASIWQGSSGLWYVNNVKELGRGSGLWYTPARLLKKDLGDYVKMMHDDFHANIQYFKDQCFVMFSWDNYNDANKYKLWINKKAREGSWKI